MTIIEAAKQASQPGGAIRRAAWEEGANSFRAQRWARWQGDRGGGRAPCYVEDWFDEVEDRWVPQNAYALFIFSLEDLAADDWEVKE